MATYRVDAQTVLEVGAALVDLGGALASMGDPHADRWAFGPGPAGAAVEELLGGWRHARLGLAEALAVLGEAAAEAGGAYVDTEAGLAHSLHGGPTA
ncbi:hypothetical protein H9L10_07350 [Phycicoccus endophyticus]|uniref:Uncharacterized protein n=1 Tax=Phycicoccus endophyticus TaxID=1690220 RepID=A0A7G9R565_9MICO|nr:hypothetical protein [Phycicoccus endophyticus]NHI20657.1 hypothetical protein [Phycicoccus endophyticus]QNN50740.1 hypothetical protein H9L10_07350 [Phycicoccus endophyticus]GGL43505.1 hypothetical protein GCM10012283_27590 [Phycicoccus endophyticus]